MEQHESPVNQESLIKPFEVGISTKANVEHPLSNEDSVFTKEKNDGTIIFGVFDGMGGAANGKESSNFCSYAIESQMDGISSTISPQGIGDKLRTISEDVNDEFLDKKSEIQLGGSTGVFGMILPDKSGGHMAVIANIGDSRAYVFRDGELIRLTTDQGLVKETKIQDRLDEVMNRDELTAEEKIAFDNRRVITGCFGNPSVNPEIVTFPLEKGDILLVTTDGVHDNLTTTEIRNILFQQKEKSSFNISKAIIDSSVRRSQEGISRSKADDMTALVIKIGENSTSEPKGEILSPQPSPETFTPRINQVVNVQRSSGLIESDWVIKFIDDNGIVVHKNEVNGKIIIRRFTQNELARFNSQPKTSDIATSENFHQLFFFINRIEGIQGSDNFYSKDYLISTIKKYLKGEASIKNITRAEGLRDIVEVLSGKK